MRFKIAIAMLVGLPWVIALAYGSSACLVAWAWLKSRLDKHTDI